ncbi:Nucleotide-binding universal stress protein, UspA family [Pricia antarctica]|uniref:Nucleotide-binding universal stress protein, UspA family n=1 Tax=Pricia antarctica TaxID=641691 RepID=A0A1G7C6N4_9FLAO|nr:universal stress protein [Pricia antarctica]SDE34873.1 Nucleotide-binding universal stress protein, UspA family [Pricia antarctica]
MKNILVATDFSHEAYCALFYATKLLASLFDASIRIMHITEEEMLNSKQESNQKLLEDCLNATVHSYHKVREFDDKALVIESFLEKQHIDLFAMVHHKHSFLEMLVREPVINDISIYAAIPMLILPEQN